MFKSFFFTAWYWQAPYWSGDGVVPPVDAGLPHGLQFLATMGKLRAF